MTARLPRFCTDCGSWFDGAELIQHCPPIAAGEQLLSSAHTSRSKNLLTPWPLVDRIAEIVAAGGLHRDELAERLQPVEFAAFHKALMIATRTKRVDWCGAYVVKPSAERKAS